VITFVRLYAPLKGGRDLQPQWLTRPTNNNYTFSMVISRCVSDTKLMLSEIMSLTCYHFQVADNNDSIIIFYPGRYAKLYFVFVVVEAINHGRASSHHSPSLSASTASFDSFKANQQSPPIRPASVVGYLTTLHGIAL